MPMKAQLTSNGFEDLTTPEQVEAAIKQEGTTLVMVNSVCGCYRRCCKTRSCNVIR
jgi:putative YphP/YqiW family bacilliredoxin